MADYQFQFGAAEALSEDDSDRWRIIRRQLEAAMVHPRVRQCERRSSHFGRRKARPRDQ
jgi:hypothetical protein